MPTRLVMLSNSKMVLTEVEFTWQQTIPQKAQKRMGQTTMLMASTPTTVEKALEFLNPLNLEVPMNPLLQNLKGAE